MIMKFEKRAGRLKWYAKLEKMSQIRAWTQVPNDRHFYACGDFETAYAQDNLNTAEHTAAAFRMRNDGEMMWYATFSGVNPDLQPRKKWTDASVSSTTLLPETQDFLSLSRER
jgi:hypothetical protein